MRWVSLLATSGLFAIGSCSVKRTIIQNGQVKITDYPDTAINLSAYSFHSYPANASEIAYKGRWDSKKVSWWTAPGLKFGYTGQTVAITFGPHTINKTLVGYRMDGMDWQFTNVTTGGTHLFVTSANHPNATYPFNPSTFELRVSNWGYGIQIDQVHLGAGEKLLNIPNFGRTIEFIGDSLQAGMYTSYEAMSGFAYECGAGLGNTEFSITAYPGICVSDQDCWGNPRGQAHQWFYASDTSWRASDIWGDNPEPWNFSHYPAADLVVINIGTNDANTHNNVTNATYVESYKKLIAGVHGVWPKAQVIVMSLWKGWYQYGNGYGQDTKFTEEVLEVYNYFASKEYLDNPWTWDGTKNATTKLGKPSEPFVHYFNTTGILQHNDNGPGYHPTDIGAIKVAAHLIRYINIKFGWDLYATASEVQHDTLYWNNEPNY